MPDVSRQHRHDSSIPHRNPEPKLQIACSLFPAVPLLKALLLCSLHEATWHTPYKQSTKTQQTHVGVELPAFPWPCQIVTHRLPIHFKTHRARIVHYLPGSHCLPALALRHLNAGVKRRYRPTHLAQVCLHGSFAAAPFSYLQTADLLHRPQLSALR